MARSRPIATFYGSSDRVASSTTVKHATVSAVKRMVAGDYKSADILDENGRPAVWITTGKREIHVTILKPRSFK